MNLVLLLQNLEILMRAYFGTLHGKVNIVANALRGHMLDDENPHHTTKAQIGLGRVANMPPSTKADAVQCKLNTSYMTPLRTGEAIDEQVYAVLETVFTTAKDNL